MPCPITQIRNNVLILRGDKDDFFSKNTAPSGIRNITAGSDIGKAARSNHCATSLCDDILRYTTPQMMPCSEMKTLVD